ncbi:MAG: hypothetical protein K6F84_04480, partial [Lachnospiraceae bacterium]|nr:hypothetical protein [Lachnospiraceae bacterium]
SNYITFRQGYIDKKINGDYLSSYREIFWELQLVPTIIRYGVSDMKLPFLPYTCTCIPGNKLSVRANGLIDMCEKINGTFSIGNCDSGLDIGRITDIVKMYKSVVTDECYKCPISKQCGICYAQCCKDGEFSKPSCEELRLMYQTNLSIVYTILENNPTAFDNFVYRDEWILNS